MSERETTAEQIGALVLAAGESRRMGAENKLLASLGGKPMLHHAVDAVLGAGIVRVGVVTGYQAERIRECLADRAVEFCHNAAYSEGLSTSLGAGLAWVAPELQGVLVCLGDMPGLRSEHVRGLIENFDPRGAAPICVPRYQGLRGNPVLWPRDYFEEMCGLEGDQGARQLLVRHAQRIQYVDFEDEGVIRDIDTPEDLAGGG